MLQLILVDFSGGVGLPGHSEAFSRVLIDQLLKDGGWDLLDAHQVHFELNGSTGRADSVLSGSHGPLCVLEVPREQQPAQFWVSAHADHGEESRTRRRREGTGK